MNDEFGIELPGILSDCLLGTVAGLTGKPVIYPFDRSVGSRDGRFVKSVLRLEKLRCLN